MKKLKKIILFGEPPILEQLFEYISKISNIEIVSIFTDDKNFHNKNYQYKIKYCSEIKSDIILDFIENLSADWFISVNNYSYIIPKNILKLFPNQAINLHFGNLPEYAGRHAYQWAIRNGEIETGVCIHIMNDKYDSGPIITSCKIPINEIDTGLSIYMKLMKEGLNLTKKFINDLSQDKKFSIENQNLNNRVAYKLSDIGDGKINWKKNSNEIKNFIRASVFDPFESPSYFAWTIYKEKKIKIKKINIIEDISYRYSESKPGSIIYKENNKFGYIAGDNKFILIEKYEILSDE